MSDAFVLAAGPLVSVGVEPTPRGSSVARKPSKGPKVREEYSSSLASRAGICSLSCFLLLQWYFLALAVRGVNCYRSTQPLAILLHLQHHASQR